MADKKQSEETKVDIADTSVAETDTETKATDTLTEPVDAETAEAKPEQSGDSPDPEQDVQVETDASADPEVVAEADQPVDDEQHDEAIVPEQTAEPSYAEPRAPEPQQVIERRGGFGAALLGGVVAAGLGFVAGQTNVLNEFLPPSWRSAPGVDAAQLESVELELNAKIAELEARLSDTTAPSLDPIETQLNALTQELDALRSAGTSSGTADMTDALDLLAQRVDALESRPITDAASPEAVAAFEAELAKLQDNLAAQSAEIEQKLAEASEMEIASAEAARLASAQTVVARLRGAIDAGASYAGLLDELTALGVDVPDALAGSAEGGVSTLSSLRDSFAPAARDALAVARDETKGTGGLAAYVRRQLGARSVEPRDGEDPDAVLSRAEAGVHAGNLQGALDELSTLPEAARAPLADWEAAARARLSAVAAVNELATSLTAK